MTYTREQLLDETMHIRAKAWATFGAVDDDLLTHLINPAFMGGPRWPAMRQAYRVARQSGSVLLASDGLADPFDDAEGPQDRNGHEIEFFAITGDPLDEVAGSWLWDLVWQMSNFAANHGGLRGLIDQLGTLSTELFDVKIPEAHQPKFVNEAGRVGVLLGLQDSAVPPLAKGPLSGIRLVNVKLLTIAEVELAAVEAEAGREKLAELFAQQGGVGFSSLLRPSVV